MKIIKDGIFIQKFECEECGCIFELDTQEQSQDMKEYVSIISGKTVVCCPQCNHFTPLEKN